MKGAGREPGRATRRFRVYGKTAQMAAPLATLERAEADFLARIDALAEG